MTKSNDIRRCRRPLAVMFSAVALMVGTAIVFVATCCMNNYNILSVPQTLRGIFLRREDILTSSLHDDMQNNNNHDDDQKKKKKKKKNIRKIGNMNGKYRLAATPGAKDTDRLFPTNYQDYPEKKTHYFDVYSPPIQQLYSQVFWKSLSPISLPQEVVQEFQTNNKTMAVVGFELDQVMTLDNGTEISIPMNVLYNHHFESTMIGGNAQFELVMPDAEDEEEDDALHAATMGHGRSPHQPYYKVVDHQGVSDSGLPPTHAVFGGANGGEMRKSFHGYAPRFAQLIHSPKEIQITPMQIDTWNRDAMDIHHVKNPKFVPGPLPQNSLAPMENPLYSGLLECPVTTRITKHLPVEYQWWNGPMDLSANNMDTTCPEGLHAMTNAKACFEAVQTLLPDTTPFTTASGNTNRYPAGCSVAVYHDVLSKAKPEHYQVRAYYNPIDDNNDDDDDHSYNDDSIPCGQAGYGQSPTQYYSESISDSLVSWSAQIDMESNQVLLTLTGPTDVWFAVGFGGQAMKDHPWTIVVEPDPLDDFNVRLSERILGDHNSGTMINPPTITLEDVDYDPRDDTNLKTIQVSRPAIGHDYFDFNVISSNMTSIPFLRAIGSSMDFGYHQAKEASSTFVLPVTKIGGTCICELDPPPFGHSNGGGSALEYHPVTNDPSEQGQNEKVRWNNHCTDSPRTNLLEQKNPTCDIRSYVGGQIACHHMWSLLDAHQSIPWPDQPLKYHLKFRFWYQDYDPYYHHQVYRTTWGIASPVEYDVPKCDDESMSGCSKDPITGDWIHTIQGAFTVNSGPLVSAHFHCHAPTCLTTSLYLCNEGIGPEDCTAETSRLICRQEAVYENDEGQGSDSDRRFQEPGFIAQPPCLWGSMEYGLESPIDVKGRTLLATKTANATYGHHGEMAWLQMYYIEGDNDDDHDE